MDQNKALEMLKDEISAKLDEDTIGRLKNAKSSKDALAILEGASIELDDELLSAVAAGTDEEDGVYWCGDKHTCNNVCGMYKGPCFHYCARY